MNPRIALAVLAAASLAFLSSPAEARPRNGVATMTSPSYDVAAVAPYPTAKMPGYGAGLGGSRAAKVSRTGDGGTQEQSAYQQASYGETAGGIVGGRPPGCPWRYCGCGVSLKVFGRIIPELNLAYNWIRKFPRTSPAAGMVAARSGHVFYIESVVDAHTVVAYDPNSGGHKTRIHTVSLRGYSVVDPHARAVADRAGRRL